MMVLLVPRVTLETWAREVPSDLKVLTETSEFLVPQVSWVSEDSLVDLGWWDQLGNLVRPGSRARMGRTESRGPGEYPAWWGDRAGWGILARWD